MTFSNSSELAQILVYVLVLDDPVLTYLLTKYLRKEESPVCTYVLKWPPFNLSRSIHAKNSKPFPSAILAL